MGNMPLIACGGAGNITHLKEGLNKAALTLLCWKYVCVSW